MVHSKRRTPPHKDHISVPSCDLGRRRSDSVHRFLLELDPDFLRGRYRTDRLQWLVGHKPHISRFSFGCKERRVVPCIPAQYWCTHPWEGAWCSCTRCTRLGDPDKRIVYVRTALGIAKRLLAFGALRHGALVRAGHSAARDPPSRSCVGSPGVGIGHECLFGHPSSHW